MQTLPKQASLPVPTRRSISVIGSTFTLARIPFFEGKPEGLFEYAYVPSIKISGPLDENGYVAYCLATQMNLDMACAELSDKLLLPKSSFTDLGRFLFSEDETRLYWLGEISETATHLESIAEWLFDEEGQRYFNLSNVPYLPTSTEFDVISDEIIAEYVLSRWYEHSQAELSKDGRKIEDFKIELTLTQPDVGFATTVSTI